MSYEKRKELSYLFFASKFCPKLLNDNKIDNAKSVPTIKMHVLISLMI